MSTYGKDASQPKTKTFYIFLLFEITTKQNTKVDGKSFSSQLVAITFSWDACVCGKLAFWKRCYNLTFKNSNQVYFVCFQQQNVIQAVAILRHHHVTYTVSTDSWIQVLHVKKMKAQKFYEKTGDSPTNLGAE